MTVGRKKIAAVGGSSMISLLDKFKGEFDTRIYWRETTPALLGEPLPLTEINVQDALLRKFLDRNIFSKSIRDNLLRMDFDVFISEFIRDILLQNIQTGGICYTNPNALFIEERVDLRRLFGAEFRVIDESIESYFEWLRPYLDGYYRTLLEPMLSAGKTVILLQQYPSRFQFDTQTGMNELLPADVWNRQYDTLRKIYDHIGSKHAGIKRLAIDDELNFTSWSAAYEPHVYHLNDFAQSRVAAEVYGIINDCEPASVEKYLKASKGTSTTEMSKAVAAMDAKMEEIDRIERNQLRRLKDIAALS